MCCTIVVVNKASATTTQRGGLAYSHGSLLHLGGTTMPSGLGHAAKMSALYQQQTCLERAGAQEGSSLLYA